MKKIIGFLGVAVFAIAMFFNTNLVNESGSDLSLANLTTINTAEALCESAGIVDGRCDFTSDWCYPITFNADCDITLNY